MKFREIQFGTPEFDEALKLRYDVLRAPLDLDFEASDIAEEWKEHHLAGFHSNGSLCAILVFKIINDSTLKMRQVAVQSTMQQNGIGKNLIQFAEKWALSFGFSNIELHARKNVVNFYESRLYRKVGKEFLEVGIPHFKMSKKLK